MASRPENPYLRFKVQAEQDPPNPYARFRKQAAETEPAEGLAPRSLSVPSDLSRLAPVAADATRVRESKLPVSDSTMAAHDLVAETLGIPSPTLPEQRKPLGALGRWPATAAQDVTAAEPRDQLPQARRANLKALSRSEVLAVEQRKREEAEREALKARYRELTDIPGLPGAGAVLRTGMGFNKGVANAAMLGQLDESVDWANRLVARALNKAAPPSVEETYPKVRSGAATAAEVGGFIYGAGSLIGAQNQVLGRIGSKLPETSKAGNFLRSFNPSTPVTPLRAATQSAVESIPFDLAYDAQDGKQRATNVVAGMTLGAGLGPLLRKTTSAQPDRLQDIVAGPTADQSAESLGNRASRIVQPQTRTPDATTPRQTPTERRPAAIAEVPTESVKLDPARFQYKLGTDASGVTQELKPVKKFDPNLAGLVQVWRDPADGQSYVINGHHRVELAQRTGHPTLAVRFVDAPDANAARQLGALTNVAEGRGTAIDAAKLFRESSLTSEELAERGISLKGAVARDGIALSKLHPTLFARVVNAELPVPRAAVIGGSGLDDEGQLAVLQMLEQQERRGRQISNEALGELIRFVRGAGDVQVQQSTLFGEETIGKSLALEKAELSAFVKEKLAKDRKLFGYLTRSGRAGRIEESGVGRIESGKAGQVAETSAQAEEIYGKLSGMSGPIGQALNDAAAQLAKGGDPNAVREALYTRVREAIEIESGNLGRAEAPAGGRDTPTGPVRPDQPAQTGAPEASGVEPPPFQDPNQSGFDLARTNPFLRFRNLKDNPFAPGPDIETHYTPGEIRENIEAHKARQAAFPISADDVAGFAEAKHTTIEDAAQRLTRAGYTVRPEVLQEARFLGRNSKIPANETPRVYGPEPGPTYEFTPEALEARNREFGNAPKSREVDALEVQDDMFGGTPKVTGDVQTSMQGLGTPQTLRQAESRANASIARLGQLVKAGSASEAQQTEYREALALLRRGEGLSAEETSLAARSEFPNQATAENPQLKSGDLFEGVNPDAIIPRDVDALRDRSMQGRLPNAKRIEAGRPLAPGQSLDIPDRKKMIADMAAALDVPMRVGKFKGKGVLGIYKRQPEVVRSRTAQDIETLAHEATHHIHKMVFGLNPKTGSLAQKPLQPWANELKPISYDGSLKEGYAEFGRLYVTNPTAAQNAAPNFYAFIEGKLTSEWPEALEVLKRVRDDYKLWTEAPAQARVEAQFSKIETKEAQEPEFLKVMSPWDRLRTRALDDLLPLRVLTREARGLGRTAADDIAEDAGTLADLARGSAGQAELFIEHGAIDFKTRKKIGPSLKEVFDPIRKKGKLSDEQYRAFRRYSVAKRVDYLYNTRKSVSYLGIEHEDALQTIKELESPEFEDALSRYGAWNHHMLRWLVDAGVMSDGAFKRIKARNSIYVPLMREQERGLGGIGNRGLLNKKDPVKKLKGSGRQILDPFEESLKRAYEYTRLAAKQQVSNAIVELAKKPGMGKFIEQVPAPSKAMKMPTEEVLTQLAQFLGLSQQDVQAIMASGQLPDFLMTFRPSDFLEENMISVLQKGRRVFYEVDPALFRSLQGLDGEQIGTLTKIAAIPAKTLRAGATLAPEFFLRNPIRDQVMAGVQSEWGYVPFWDLGRGLASLLKKDEYWHAFKSGGGSRSSLLDLDRATIRKEARKALEVEGGIPNVIGSPVEALKLLDRVLDPLRKFSATMEDATRVGETRRALTSLRGQGVPEGEAVQRSAKAGREVSIDFARHGLEGARLRAMTAFWNAQIQGYDRLTRSFKTDPAGTSLRAMSMVTVPSVIEYMVYRDDPEYFELPRWQKDLFWMFKVGDSWWRVPKPFELGIVFGSVPQRILEWMDEHDSEGFERLVTETLKQQAEGLLPVPTFLSPLVDNFANYSRFMNRPIVPRGLEGVDAREQYTSETSTVSKGLGRIIGVSPLKLDNMLFSYTGGLGRLASETVDLAIEGGRESRPLASLLPGVRGFAVRSPGASSESVERLYKERETADRRAATLSKYEREGRASDAILYEEKHRDILARRSQLGDAATDLTESRKLMSEIQASDLPANEKRRLVQQIEKQMMLSAAGAVRSPAYANRLQKVVTR